MKFTEIKFRDTASKRVYDNYIKRVKNMLKPLSAKDQQEVLLEFNSHIYEGLQHQEEGEEIDRLLNVLDKLGARKRF